MGRKNRNTLSKKEIVEDEDDSGSEDEEDQTEQEYHFLSKILALRENMLDYCDKQGLPLCEFLSPELMIDFVNWAHT